MKKLRTLILLLTVTSCFFSSCQKGDTGPAGLDGLDGNANVKSTGITINDYDWTYDSYLNEWYTKISWNNVTNSVINNGTVEVFLAYTNGSYQALPLTVYSGTYGYSFNYIVSPGQIEIDVDAGLDQSGSNPGTTSVKIVAIDGSARIKLQQKGINLTDYKGVKSYFKLKD